MQDLASAIQQFNAGRLDDAAATCISVLRGSPRNDAAVNLLGAIEMKRGNLGEARDHFAKALAMVPGHADYRSNFVSTSVRYADSLLIKGAFRAALPIYAELTADATLDPKMLPGLNGRIRDVTMVADLLTDESLFQEFGPREPPPELVDGFRDQLPSGDAPAVVFFHVQKYDTAALDHLLGKQSEQIDFRQLMTAAIRMARLTNPDARVIVLTDRTTEMAPFDGASIVRLPIAGEHLMYERMVCYHALAASGRVTGPTIHLDTDVCLNHDFRELSFDTFDVGLTYRLTPHLLHMPVNEGVILTSTADAALRFFGACLHIYDRLRALTVANARYNFDVGIWRGGQLSLGAFCRWQVPPNRPATDTVRGLRCRFLPCEQYNFTPDAQPSVSDMADKWAIHFKGARKPWASAYLAEYTRR